MAKVRGAAIADLLDWEPPRVAVGLDPQLVRASTLKSRISKAVGAALKAGGKSRDAIAALMSEQLGSPITATMLDAYASEAKDGHQITVERFMALVEATGCHDLLGFICDPFGYTVLPARYADIVALHQIEEHLDLMQQRRSALQARARSFK